MSLIETRLRVLTWNLWWRFGGAWKRREPLIAEAIETSGADLVALQEVWEDGGDNQAERLAAGLGFHWCYHRVSENRGIGFGNAILSRWPIARDARELLPTGRENARGVLHAEIDGPRGRIGLFSTHLSWRLSESDIRQSQVERLMRFVARQGERESRPAMPPLVCGDFNAVACADEIRLLNGERATPVRGLVLLDAWLAAGRHAEPGFTWDNENPCARGELEPNRRIDYVFVGKPRRNGAGHVLDARLVGREPHDGLCPSDHYGVLCELRY